MAHTQSKHTDPGAITSFFRLSNRHISASLRRFSEHADSGQQYGFSSLYEADAVRKRPQRPQSDKYEINALYVGGAAFVTASYEMFSASALEIKGSSPFETTFVVTCANFGVSYIPTVDSFEYDGVESYEGKSCKYAPGTGEELAVKYVAMLTELYATKA